MKLIGLVLRSYGSKWFRRWYWWFRLSKASLGRNVRVQFPLRLEGRGFLQIGDNTVVEENVTLQCAAGSEMRFGLGCVLERGSAVQTGMGASLNFEKGCKVGSYTVIRCADRWVIGTGSSIASYCQIFAREQGQGGSLVIGTNSYILDNSIIDLSGGLTIGDNVAIGPHSIVYTHDHRYAHDGPVAWMGEIERKRVLIGDGAWIGARVTILPGVVIGERAVVAAGAVVTRDVPPKTLVGGVPAKPLASAPASIAS